MAGPAGHRTPESAGHRTPDAAGQRTLVPAGSADQLVELLASRGLTVATAESVTGGLLAAGVTEVPGASTVFRGGFVVYATDTKEAVGGVPPDVLEREGPVSEGSARALAEGARQAFASSLGLAVTGVAGPDPQPGQPDVPVGTVYVAVASEAGTDVVRLGLRGDRGEVREAAVAAALEALGDAIRAGADGEGLRRPGGPNATGR